MPHNSIRFLASLFLAIILCITVAHSHAATQWTVGDAHLLYDLVNEFDRGTVENSMEAHGSQREPCGGKSYPGIFLHPMPDGDAIWRLPINLPKLRPDEKLIFLGFVGLRDGIPWGDPNSPEANGVDFQVRIGERTCVAATVTGPGKTPIACDLTLFNGQEIELSLVTSARDNPNYDWAIFGRPEILRLTNRRTASQEEISENGTSFSSKGMVNGVIIAEVLEPDGPVNVVISQDSIALVPGQTDQTPEKGWLARRFSMPQGDENRVLMTLAAPPEECEVYRFTPLLEIEEFAPANALPLLGKNEFAIRITNKGRGYYQSDGEPLEIQLIDALTNSAEIKDKFIVKGPHNLAPGESVVLRLGPFDIQDNLHYALRAYLPKQKISSPNLIWGEFYSPAERGAAALTCGDYQISFPKYDQKYPAGIIERKNGKNSEPIQIGAITPLTSATYKWNGELKEWPLIKDTIDWVGERELVISEMIDLDGAQVTQSVQFTSNPDRGVIEFTSMLQISSGQLEVHHFSGPRIAFGEGAFGTEHGYALFPGLEYLGPNDQSSSTLDAVNPIAQRGTPDPMKITIPLMAVEHENDLVGMFWDPYQKWQAGYNMPGAQFNVPPKDGMQDYSSMSLYAPPPPEWRQETSKDTINPLTLTPDHPIKLTGSIYLENKDNPKRPKSAQTPIKGEFILTALIKYFDLNGIPKMIEPPRDWEDLKALSRQAWLSTVWDEESMGWRHCAGESWTPAPAPGMATLLLFDSLDTADPEIQAGLKKTINQVMDNAVKTRGPGFLSSNINCHIMHGEYPFYDGHLKESLEEWIAYGQRLINSQGEDGSWSWNPGNDAQRQNLGTPGQTTSGTCGNSAALLLRLGRVLGDSQFIEAGLKGLEALERHRVPRGAQGWECPLHSPDILASGYAVRANVEAYRITGDEKYLDQARYWAWSGLPFIYIWNIDAIPSMRFNTIPIFGATFYTHTWFGRPVIWCGLVYAYAVQQLAEYDTGFNWKAIAEGITASARWQQYEPDHKSAGCYPDSFDLRLNERNPADINPEDIMVNAYTLRGFDPGIKTKKLERKGETLTISSGARIERVSGDETISISLSFFNGATVNTLLTPVPNVSRILLGDRELKEADRLEEVSEGYQIVKDHQWLIIKTKFDKPNMEIHIHAEK